jgi:hypothetical protein
VADDVGESEAPADDELRVLRELKSTLEKAVA